MNIINKIPKLKEVADVSMINTIENNEKLVDLNKIKSEKIISYSKSYKNNITGSIEEVLVRETVLEKIKIASENLPEGYKLVVWETYTPRSLQEFLRKVKLEDISMLPHMTGGGIDVSLANENGEIIDMGTDLSDDAPQNKTTLHFENIENPNDKEIEYREKRRILFEAMSSAGFTNNPTKWFHWDYGNKWWAKVKNTDAIYGSVDQ